jgi:deoxyribonuclease V
MHALWPASREALEHLQRTLAEQSEREARWLPPTDRATRVGAVFAATPRGVEGIGAAGEPGWAAAVVMEDGRLVDSALESGAFDAPYAPGLLAMREGRLLQEAIGKLRITPDVVIVNATGRDHPRRAGLALHLGAATELPTIGVTDRPLLAKAMEPGPDRGAVSELWLGSELVGFRLRTRAGVRPVVVHAGWRVDPQTASTVVISVSGDGRTPGPLRAARQFARTTRSANDQ